MAIGVGTRSYAQPPARIFWVDSYDEGYAWSDGIEQGIQNVFLGQDVEFGSFHMATKDCRTPACMQSTALLAKKAIEAFTPDVLIASDDNAQKFLVVPYYKNSSLPVVFCGVNWDATAYGYPSKTITGMIEVDMAKETIEHMQRFAAGDRIGYISGDTVSDRKNINWLNRHFFNMEMQAVRVKNFIEFKQHFIELQTRVDMLFIRNHAGIEGWEELAAKKFIAKNLTIPTGSNNDFMAPYVIFTLGKIPWEQGQYAAQTALKIARGAPVSDFPVVTNEKARLIINLEMAQAAKIVLPVSSLKIATVIGQKAYRQKQAGQELTLKRFAGKRIAWVDSYHQGYEWSDCIGRAIREAFFDTKIDLKIFRMDTKRKNTDVQIKAAALRIKTELDKFNPDVIIASDDNAQKYLVVPFYKGGQTPVVFCGVNWDATVYGYPTPNITGMIETNLIQESIAVIKPYALGNRIGYLAGDVVTERKVAAIYKAQLYGDRLKTYLVKSQAEFEKSFLAAQKEVDILFFSNYTGIHDWDFKRAENFIFQNTKIPSGSDNAFMEQLVAVTMAKLPEEQGHHAALTALRILNGCPPAVIPVVKNKETSLVFNLKLAKKADMIFPLSVIKQARIIGQNALK